MRHEFVDRTCRALPGALRDQPFGPDTVVWKINFHMFAAYTETGPGLSVRTANMPRAMGVIRRTSPLAAPFLTGGNWVLLPWETSPDELRARILESFALVRAEWPRAMPPMAPHQGDD
jgi:predicted DNA-binding protein (MmcQ/YjbR family)